MARGIAAHDPALPAGEELPWPAPGCVDAAEKWNDRARRRPGRCRVCALLGNTTLQRPGEVAV